MATPHNSAKAGDFAKTVLMPGDPLRAKFIAETFLENPQLVTSVRNVYGYTGTYKGKKVSVMASGMGMPSIGIYSYELYSQYGVENIIRVGSAGSYSADLNIYDVVLAESAYSESNYAKVQCGCEDDVLYPTKELNDRIIETAKKLGMECKVERIHSSDVFYQEADRGSFERYPKEHGAKCVEMESFALFNNARILGKKAACLLTISDSMVTHEETTAEERQKSFTKMMELALEAAE
ncbi:MAG: purine-nucleoside phosphorylase [Lachnospiraceae bacterium]|jgi:purine-nucleoside phosphorylase|nr:purine-nucleoside phosphorylase [Lachnospiraceae bacterium]